MHLLTVFLHQQRDREQQHEEREDSDDRADGKHHAGRHVEEVAGCRVGFIAGYLVAMLSDIVLYLDITRAADIDYQA